jgi:hypothetical protein
MAAPTCARYFPWPTRHLASQVGDLVVPSVISRPRCNRVIVGPLCNPRWLPAKSAYIMSLKEFFHHSRYSGRLGEHHDGQVEEAGRR